MDKMSQDKEICPWCHICLSSWTLWSFFGFMNPILRSCLWLQCLPYLRPVSGHLWTRCKARSAGCPPGDAGADIPSQPAIPQRPGLGPADLSLLLAPCCACWALS